MPPPGIRPSGWEKQAAFVFGLTFGIDLLAIAILVPSPTRVQLGLYRITLALAAAGVGAIIPGFLHIEGKTALCVIRAGGALGVFLLIYLLNPPALLRTFPFTVYLQVPKGNQELIRKREGYVQIETDGLERKAQIIKEGDTFSAFFREIPENFRRQQVNVLLDADGYELDDPNQKLQLNGDFAYLTVKQRAGH